MTATSTSRPFPAPLVDDDTAARVALAAAGVGGDIAVSIGIRVFGGASRFVAAVHDQQDAIVPLTNIVRSRIRTYATAAHAVRILERTAKRGLGILTPLHDSWPAQFGAMRGAAPLLLWVRGDEWALSAPSIAMAGASSPSEQEKQTAIELATGLASRGWVLVSGTNRPIDSLVWRSAEAMKSQSITLSATGLAEQPSATRFGVQVSELPPGFEASIDSQRRAKQLVAAIAGKVIIDESSASSTNASMLHAATAMKRPVGLLPGILDSRDVSLPPRTGPLRGVTVITSIRDADQFH